MRSFTGRQRIQSSLYRNFRSRDELSREPSKFFSLLQKFGLCMHVRRGDTAPKTEAMYFPPPRTAHMRLQTNQVFVYYSLYAGADVDKRLTSATTSFLSLPEGGTGFSRLVTNKQDSI